MLLENVLPLAHRRTFHRAPVGDRAVQSVLVEHLGRGLDGIFDHLTTKSRKKKVIGYREFVVLCDFVEAALWFELLPAHSSHQVLCDAFKVR